MTKEELDKLKKELDDLKAKKREVKNKMNNTELRMARDAAKADLDTNESRLQQYEAMAEGNKLVKETMLLRDKNRFVKAKVGVFRDLLHSDTGDGQFKAYGENYKDLVMNEAKAELLERSAEAVKKSTQMQLMKDNYPTSTEIETKRKDIQTNLDKQIAANEKLQDEIDNLQNQVDYNNRLKELTKEEAKKSTDLAVRRDKLLAQQKAIEGNLVYEEREVDDGFESDGVTKKTKKVKVPVSYNPNSDLAQYVIANARMEEENKQYAEINKLENEYQEATAKQLAANERQAYYSTSKAAELQKLIVQKEKNLKDATVNNQLYDQLYELNKKYNESKLIAAINDPNNVVKHENPDGTVYTEANAYHNNDTLNLVQQTVHKLGVLEKEFADVRDLDRQIEAAKEGHQIEWENFLKTNTLWSDLYDKPFTGTVKARHDLLTNFQKYMKTQKSYNEKRKVEKLEEELEEERRRNSEPSNLQKLQDLVKDYPVGYELFKNEHHYTGVDWPDESWRQDEIDDIYDSFKKKIEDNPARAEAYAGKVPIPKYDWNLARKNIGPKALLEQFKLRDGDTGDWADTKFQDWIDTSPSYINPKDILSIWPDADLSQVNFRNPQYYFHTLQL